MFINFTVRYQNLALCRQNTCTLGIPTQMQTFSLSMESVGKMAKLSFLCFILVSEKKIEGWEEREQQNDHKSEVTDIILLSVCSGSQHNA